MPVIATKKGKRNLNFGSGGRKPKKTKIVPTTMIPQTPQIANNIALLDDKPKDHSKVV